MSVLLWCKKITLILLIGESCNANIDCKNISACELVCDTNGPSYGCNGRGLIEVPSFPESTVKLNLGRNNLIVLPDDVFSNNLELLDVDLSQNKLTSLPDGVFRKNVALSFVFISGNSLMTLPPNLFSSNVDLTDLDLSKNKLTSLPDGVFRNNVALSFVDLAYNNLAILPGDVFRNSVALEYVFIGWNPLATLPINLFFSNVGLQTLDLSNNNLNSVPVGVFEKNVALKFLMCTTCLDCDCLSASTYQWIKHIVIDNNVYEFTCHNGVVLPNTVFNCSDDGSRLAVTSIENGSSCNCKDSITKQLSSMDVTIETTPAIESTSDKNQHKDITNELDSSYTYTAGIISGMVASLSLIITYTALKRIIHTMSRIKHSDITDNEINKTTNDGFDFIPTVYGEMAKKYNNIPPKSHINTIDNGIDVLKTLNYNEQMNKEYDNIPPKSHITLSSFSNMSNVHHTMVLEGIQPVEACDIFYVETFPNSTLVHKTCV